MKAINGKYGVNATKWLPSQINNKDRFSKIWRDICEIGSEGSNFEWIISEGFRINVGSGMTLLFGMILGMASIL